MNDDCLKVLQGEKHQEVQNMITVVQASIEKEKKDTHQLEEMVLNHGPCACIIDS